ncbi:DUF7112 family protein [Haloarchaeobius iranensis]|uniref:Uncharacterized protein n=1 Tax=Haloarchaeobius iranensis TaxID=996166 RepID=A0A1G9ZHY4_9EURY|nr:hypothetical protein [Haloarchaeobius iranensis]SDN20667.1 hypothetical protein SAMN05192554_12050 [Haloarchaeobius iranensis]
MADRVSSDAVPTVRATLAKHGATGRLKLELPGDETDRFPVDEVVRLVLDGDQYFARIESALTGDELLIAGAFETPSAARNPGEGENHFTGWCEANGRDAGGSVLVDVIEDGFQYGLRAPGGRAVYDALEQPDGSLASIASELED